MFKKIKYSWNDLNKDVNRISEILTNYPYIKEIKNIYGIPRGGLIIAVMLSNKLNLPLIYSKSKITNNTLIVDDIADSGATLKKVLGRKECKVITLYLKEGCKVTPSLWIREVIETKWVVFPWEDESNKMERNGTLIE